MSIASGSNTYLAYGEESTYGTAPANLTALRFTGESLNFKAASTVSNEIRADRNVSDVIRTAYSSEGAFNFELSYGTFDAFIEGLLQSTWSGAGAGATLTNGVTQKSYTIEKGMSTQASGVANKFFLFTGMVPDGMSLTMNTGAIVNGSMKFKGSNTTYGTSAQDASLTAANTNSVMNAVAHLAMTEGGSSIGNVRTLSFEIDNGLREQRAIGSQAAIGIGAGKFHVKGKMSVYFSDATVYQKFLNDTASSLTVTFDDNGGTAGGNTYIFNFPKVKYSGATIVAGSSETDIVVDLEWSALYDSGIGGTLRITR